MARGSKIDRRGSGPLFFILIALLVYFLYSVTVAAATTGECPGTQQWVFFPPGWECR
jgi:hypothetical protein